MAQLVKDIQIYALDYNTIELKINDHVFVFSTYTGGAFKDALALVLQQISQGVSVYTINIITQGHKMLDNPEGTQ